MSGSRFYADSGRIPGELADESLWHGTAPRAEVESGTGVDRAQALVIRARSLSHAGTDSKRMQ